MVIWTYVRMGCGPILQSTFIKPKFLDSLYHMSLCNKQRGMICLPNTEMLAFYILIAAWTISSGANGTSDLRLLTQALLTNYDKLTIPEGSPLKITHALHLERVVSFDNQVLSLDGYVLMQWRDDQLMWNPGDYGGITVHRIPSHILWQPDIMLDNNAEQSNGVHNGDTNMLISYDGVVSYSLPVKIKSYCNVDYTRLPRKSDVTCTLKFMSWTYDGLSIDLEPDEDIGILVDFDADFNKDWRLIRASVKKNVKNYACCQGPKLDITYTLVLKRL